MPGRLIFGCLYLCLLLPAQAQIFINQTQKPPLATNEPSLSLHPKYSHERFLASNVNLVFVSHNSGVNWERRIVESPLGFYGDPVTLITKEGKYLLCHLALNPNLKWPDWFDRIVFQRSDDGGATFTSGTGIGFSPGKVQDKPWMSVDEFKRSPHRNRIYMSWTEFDKYKSIDPADSSRIRFAYSDNWGDTFSQPAVVSDLPGDCRDGDNTVEGATTAVGPRGLVYMAWAARNKIYFDRSSDGGITWGTDQVIAEQKSGWEQEFKGIMRANSMPFLCADKRGHLHLVYGDNKEGDHDIYYKYSKDGGLTWTPDIRINRDPVGNGCDQYMPHMRTDSRTGKVYIVHYDRRHSPANIFTDVYLTELKKGKPGRQVRLTPKSFAPPGKDVFFGDYIAVDAARGHLGAAWTTYDDDGNVTVDVAALKASMLKQLEKPSIPGTLNHYSPKGSDSLILHYCFPGVDGFTMKMYRMRELVFTQGFNNLKVSEGDVVLPRTRFRSGLYEVVIESRMGRVDYRFLLD
jgi:hypothetical protein